MTNKREYYHIEFVYTDNSQSFGTGALLNSAEVGMMESQLSDFAERGLITDAHVYQPVEVKQTYSKALAEIKAALKS